MHINRRLIIKAATLFLLITMASRVDAQQNRMPPIDFEEFRNTLEAKESPEEKLREYAFMSLKADRIYPDSLFVFAKEIEQLKGIEEAERKGFKNFILAYAWRMHNRDSTIYHAQKAGQSLKQANATKEYILTANLLGTEFNRRSDYLKAESAYKDGIEFAKTIGAPVEISSQLYGNLGGLYSRVGLHDKAIEMYEFFLEHEDNPAARCNTLSKMAQSMIRVNELERANKLLSSCLEYSQLPPPIKSLVRSNLASILYRQGQKEESIAFLEEAASISVSNRVRNLEYSQPINLGMKHLELNNVQEADSIFTMLQGFDFGRTRAEIRIDKSIFFSTLAQAKGQYQQSVQFAQEAINLAERSNKEHHLKDIYATKANAHEALGELEQSVESLRRQRTLEERLKSRAEIRDEAMMKVRYQLRNKEEQLDEVSAELGTVKTRTAIIILLVILAGLYAIYRYRMHYLLKEERTRNRIAGDLHDEVSASLSSISFFAEAIKKDDPSQKENRFINLITESAGEAKDKITDIIWAINPEQDSWKALFAKCQRYASDLLESKDIKYHIDIAEDISGTPEMETKQNFWLIFKEIITNIARHSEAEHAKIFVSEKAGFLNVIIEDTGSGFDTTKDYKGNGLKNIYRRADNIDAEIKVNSDPGNGTQWEISLTH